MYRDGGRNHLWLHWRATQLHSRRASLSLLSSIARSAVRRETSCRSQEWYLSKLPCDRYCWAGPFPFLHLTSKLHACQRTLPKFWGTQLSRSLWGHQCNEGTSPIYWHELQELLPRYLKSKLNFTRFFLAGRHKIVVLVLFLSTKNPLVAFTQSS